MKTKKGFTLLELLIVIGILAILSTTMILVINPAEMLRKARDSQRISDLSTLKSAIAYYITSVGIPYIGTSTYSYSVITNISCPGAASTSATSSQAVNGNGWIPVYFATITGGSPIGSLPIDPNPTALTPSPLTKARYYVYTPYTTDFTFELLANMESLYYSKDGDGDVENKDGGVIAQIYEVGTRLGIVTASSSTCLAGDGT